MDNPYTTGMGGDKRDFPATEWTKLNSIKGLSPEEQHVISERLHARYCKPVYCFIRQQGYDNETAKDLTQGFFCDIVVRRDLLSQADKTKGKFRTFLLAALKCYLKDQLRKSQTLKRSSQEAIQPLDGEHIYTIPSQLARSSPEVVFQYQWAADLLEQAIQATKKEYLAKNKESHWRVFQEKTLRPILEDCKSPSYREICKDLENVNEQQAQSMEFKVRKSFGIVLKNLLKQQMTDESDVDMEIDELLAIFSRMGA